MSRSQSLDLLESLARRPGQPQAPHGSGWRLLGRLWTDHVRGHGVALLIALVFMSLEGAALGAFAWMVRPLFDQLFTAGSMDGVTWVALAIAGLFVVRAVSGFVQRLLVVSVGLRVTMALQARLVAHILDLDHRFFHDNPPGALIERVRGDTQALQGLASSTLMSLGRDTISVLSLLTVMFLADWRWTLIALIGIPALVLPLLALQRFIRSTTRSARQAAARLSTRLDEMFHGIQTIKLNRLERHEDARYGREIRKFLRPSIRAQAGLAANPATMDLIAAVGFVAVLYYGGTQIVSGEKTLGEFMSFFTALGLMFEPLRKLSNIAGQVQAGLASLERLYGLLEVKPTIRSADDPVPMPDGDIAFEDVQFGYDDTPVLRGLTFTAEAGKTTALVGASGAGKSTVFALLTRLVEADGGAVRIGGHAVAEVAIDALRDGIAVVGQETALFDETIAANIRMGRLDASEDAVRQAANDATVTEFADAMPGGLDTPVGPRGSALSGGQRQRVAIARALLKSAPVLLLDEPTSALDADSERAVQVALERLSQGRTTLVIAHRLSTIRAADKIVVMEAGRVIEEGTHDSLMAADGAYARLAAMQTGGT